MVDSFHAFTSAAASHIPHPLDSAPTSYITSHPHTGKTFFVHVVHVFNLITAFKLEFNQR